MILVVSDIHGNVDAFRAILQDAQNKYNIHEIAMLGDMFTLGPRPTEVFDIIRSFPNFFFLTGNHEDYLIHEVFKNPKGQIGQLDHSSEIYKLVRQSLEWTHGQIGRKDLEESLLWYSEFERRVVNNIRHYFCHGNLNSNLRGFPNQNYENYINLVRSDYLWAGHIHHQQFEKIGLGGFVNPGGSGCPFDGIQDAPYAVIDNSGHVQMHRAAYDFEKVARDSRESSNPFSEVFARQIENASLVKFPF